MGIIGKHMCEGEYESLKAFHGVSPGFVPQPYAWGKYAQPDPETYFLLTEFRDVGKQVGVFFLTLLVKDRNSSKLKVYKSHHFFSCRVEVATALELKQIAYGSSACQPSEVGSRLSKPT